MNSATTETSKTTFSKMTPATWDAQCAIGEAAMKDARALLPWTGTLLASSEMRAIVKASHPDWSADYINLVIAHA